jgi:hypothetical protein
MRTSRVCGNHMMPHCAHNASVANHVTTQINKNRTILLNSDTSFLHLSSSPPWCYFASSLMSGLFIPLADHKLLDSWTVCHSMRICGRQSNAHPVGQDMLFLSCSKHLVQFIYFLPNHRPLSQTLSFHIRPSSGMTMHKVSSRLPTFIAKPFHILGTTCLEDIFDCHVLGSSPWSWG